FRRIDELRIGRVLLHELQRHEIGKESPHDRELEGDRRGLLAFGLELIAPLPHLSWLNQPGIEISNRGEELPHHPPVCPARLLGSRPFGELRCLERIKSPEAPSS